MTKRRVMVNFFGLMEGFLKVSGRMVNKMVKE
jgi:hypothetical protein